MDRVGIKHSKPPQRHHRDRLALVVLATLVAIFMWRVVFDGKVMMPLDMAYTVEPWKSESFSPFREAQPWNWLITDAVWQFYPMAVQVEALRHQGLPLWDPNVLCGMPGIARGELFSHPLFNLLSLVLTVGGAISWAAVFGLLIGAVSMFLFLRELGAGPPGAMIGSVAFTFNGYLVGWLSLPNVTGSMIWLPLVAFGIERACNRRDWRWGLVGALAFSLQILSGSILWPFYGAFALGAIAVYRAGLNWWRERDWREALRPLTYTAVALGVGALLVTPQLLLTLELFSQTTRTEAWGSSSFLSIALHLPRLLAPTISGTPLHGGHFFGQFNYTETDLYFGVLPLFFVAAALVSARKALVAGFFGIGSIALLAVYGITPFRQIVTFVCPIFLNTFPGRVFYVVAFTWAVAAGLGADWLLESRPRRLLRVLIGVAAAAGVLLGVGALALSTGHPWKVAEWLAANLVGLARQPRLAVATVREAVHVGASSLGLATVWLVATAGVFLIVLKGWFGSKTRGGLALAVVVADLFAAGINYNPAFSGKHAFPETPSLKFLTERIKQDPEPARILTLNSNFILTGMVPEMFGLQTVTGYSSWVLRRYGDYAALVGGHASQNHMYWGKCCQRLIDAINVKYIYAWPGEVPKSSAARFRLLDRWSEARVEAQVPAAIQRTSWTIDGLTHEVLLENPRARVSFDLEVPVGAKLWTGISFNPSAWNKSGDGATFEVVVTPKDGREAKLFSRYIDPKHNVSERAWIPVEVDLARYAQQNVVLSLVTGPGPSGDNSFDWAGWTDPEVAARQGKDMELLYDGPNKVYENRAALPRAWVVRRVKPIPVGDIEAAKRELMRDDFEPSTEAVVETDAGNAGLTAAPLDAGLPGDRVRVSSYAPRRVVVEATLADAGLLVLSDAFYPGWKALVDGHEKPILATNLIMRGVFLDRGTHKVVFVYRPPLLRVGLLVAGVTLFLTLLALAVPWVLAWRSRRLAATAS